MNLIERWWLVLKHAWSIRLLALALLVQALSISVPMLEPLVPRRYLIGFSVLTFLLILGAGISRVVKQSRLEGRHDQP